MLLRSKTKKQRAQRTLKGLSNVFTVSKQKERTDLFKKSRKKALEMKYRSEKFQEDNSLINLLSTQRQENEWKQKLSLLEK